MKRDKKNNNKEQRRSREELIKERLEYIKPISPKGEFEFTIMAACARLNRVIGNRGQIPWHLPSDLKHFKEYTSGKILIMGRKTFDSIPVIMQDRVIIVLTSNFDLVQLRVDELKYKYPGSTPKVVVANNIGEVFEILPEVKEAFQVESNEVIIAGGEQIYRAFINMCDKMILTLVEGDYVGDARFPVFDRALWEKTFITDEIKEPDDEAPYRIITFTPKKTNVYEFPTGKQLSAIDLKMLKVG